MAETKGAVQTRTTTQGVVYVPFWGVDPDHWDTVLIDNRPLPGICKVRGEGFEQRIQKVKSHGRHGDVKRYVGLGNVDFEVTVELWEEEHLTKFAEILALVTHAKPPIKKVTRVREHAGLSHIVERDVVTYVSGGPRTVEVYHPALALFGIRKATVMKVGLPTRNDFSGKYDVLLRLSQLRLGKRDAGSGNKKENAQGDIDATGARVAPVPSDSIVGVNG